MTQTRQTRSIDAAFQTRAEGSERRIEGYFAVFGSNYEMFPGATESVDPHAFDGQLAGDVRALIDHDSRLVLGRTGAGTLTLRVDDHGLFGSILINEADQDAMNLFARVQRGDVTQCSFGFDILNEETINNPDGSVHWILHQVKLYEVSVCTFPAYEATEVQARRADLAQIQKRRLDLWKETQRAKLHTSQAS